MQRAGKYGPFGISAALLLLAVLLCFPYCRYYVDPDATAYLTIAERYASGDWQRAVNGYWSPWSCWLTAVLIKWGIQSFTAAIIINTAAALGFLAISQSLFRHFSVNRILQYALGLGLAVFLTYAVYKQSFADLWGCFFLLFSLRVMLSRNFLERPALWMFIGLLGCLAYFSKAYSFPFFILHTLVSVSWLTKAWNPANRKKWAAICAVSIFTMVVCSSPWIYMLYQKYGVVTTGTAGKLNMSWFLVGHPYWGEGIQYLLPPTYPNSVSYWEDPYLANGPTPQFWTSVDLFMLQIVKTGYNLLKFVRAMSELSSFMLPIWLLAAALMCSAKVRSFFSLQTPLLAISILLFPIGFLPINYEARYIWYIVPLGMTIGALVVQRLEHLLHGNHILSGLVVLVFAGSFVVWPLLDMRTIINTGKEDYTIAQQLKKENISGRFTAIGRFGDGTMPSLARIAYFSGNVWYQVPGPVTKQQLIAAAERHDVPYYFVYQPMLGEGFSDTSGKPYPEVTGGRVKGLKVYRIQP